MKFILLLMVYFAGFATAIYCLAPPAENQIQAVSAIKSNEFAKSFNTGMHKCIDFSKDTAQRAGKVIRQKLDERRLQAGE